MPKYVILLNDGETWAGIDNSLIFAFPDDYDGEAMEAAMDAFRINGEVNTDVHKMDYWGALDDSSDGPVLHPQVWDTDEQVK